MYVQRGEGEREECPLFCIKLYEMRMFTYYDDTLMVIKLKNI